MAKTKYQEYYELMIANNKALFDDFKIIHDQFVLEPQKYQDEFNKKGEEIMRVVHQWEDKLCNHSEGSGYGLYSANLAEKFKNQIRKNFPKFDEIGVKRSFFSLNKISPK